MVVKTELCAFSEYRVYPGHGMRMVRRDGQAITMGSHKVKSLVKQRKKPAKLLWTQSWRRLHKKGNIDGVAKKRTRKTARIQRAIVGVSLEELRKRRAAPKPKVNATESAKDVKDRTKKAAKSQVPKGKNANIPKIQKSAASSGRSGSTR